MSTSANLHLRRANSHARIQKAALFVLVLRAISLIRMESRAEIWMSALLGSTIANTNASIHQEAISAYVQRDILKWTTNALVRTKLYYL